MVRGMPVVEEMLDRGLAYISGPQWLAENVLQDKWVIPVAGTHGKSTTSSMVAWILADAGLNPGFLIGGIARNFHVSALATDFALLRDRGRRVRHGVLRQALEVRVVPAAHRDPEQPRARPRRHLSRPRGDRDAVPPPGAHRARQRAARGQRRGARDRARDPARLLDGRRSASARARRGAWARWTTTTPSRSCSTASRRAPCAGT